ncbi:ATPase, type iv secretory pathway virb11 component like protein [Halogeometricum pallidum JCM 14848]|uniref:ATPase, type iv secretory pathway virb11 component like protein n=1 Tax=Halogeometricum pallidum JCM 14848 TaxID=1227487 RepID=M0CSP8_HALPD|nr:type II/IV secretion system ATPase subunit [Halogeometricum pallidum]ELZ26290.1 ATPase, type iv secretory pathway virb11 component like protein [Halogeometricum pallidum JCM 14848]
MATDDDASPPARRESGGDDEDVLEGEVGGDRVALDGDVASGDATDRESQDASTDESEDGSNATVGEYSWAHFLDEFGEEGDAEALYGGRDPRAPRADSRWDDGDGPSAPTRPTREDWREVDLDPTEERYLGHHPVDTEDEIRAAAGEAARIQAEFEAFCDPETTPVVKDVWMWEHYKREYYYEDDGSSPRDDEGETEEFDAAGALGFDPDAIENALARGAQRAEELDEVVDERTVDVNEELDEDAFFSDDRGLTTATNRYDLEKAVPMEKKTHFREVERYWVNKPHSFVVIFRSAKENETKYYVVEPYQNEIEADLTEFLTGKLRTAIKYDDESTIGTGDGTRRRVIEQQSLELLERYDLYDPGPDGYSDSLSLLPGTDDDDVGEPEGPGAVESLLGRLGLGGDAADGSDAGTETAAADGGTVPDGPRDGTVGTLARRFGLNESSLGGRIDGLFAKPPRVRAGLDGIAARPEPVVLAEDAATLTEYQVEKLLYYLRRDFIGYERIDGVKHDINVEDISCDGYNSPVFVYHSDYEQIISNVFHGETELDDFVVKLAQRSGKGISKRRPQVDATLPDGSRAQLTLGREVSDHGTNYTIRQFKDVPFTPIDLINWNTFSLEEMAFLWLCIENHKSLIFAGGTASGKTTSLNAVSLFIPSNTKIVSIEDTREVELPQRNWIASVTRPSFSDDDKGDVDEFDLLEAALRQRPDYIVMGEIRGEEGRTLFQVMSTGHTTYTTFHADSVGEVLKRFTTEPINVSKTMFTALDLVSIQTSTRVQGNKVRRNKSLTEINHYDAENDEINVQDVYQWQAEDDEYLQMGSSNTLEEIRFDRGWTEETLNRELFLRRVVLAYLIDRGLNTYTQVAATLQAFINDPDTILTLMAEDELERSLEDLREMESVQINVDPEKEEMVPRPDPPEEVRDLCRDILDRAEAELFGDYRGQEAGEVADALRHVADEPDVSAGYEDHSALDALDEATRTDPELAEGGEDSPELEGGDEGDAGPSELDASDETTPALDAGDAVETDADADSDATDTDARDDGPRDGDGAETRSEELDIDDLFGEDVSTELEEDGWGFGEFEDADPKDVADDGGDGDEGNGGAGDEGAE